MVSRKITAMHSKQIFRCTTWIQPTLTYWNRRDPANHLPEASISFLDTWETEANTPTVIVRNCSGWDRCEQDDCCLAPDAGAHFCSPLTDRAKLSHLLAWLFWLQFNKLFFFVFHFFLQYFVAAAFYNSGHFTNPQSRAVSLFEH